MSVPKHAWPYKLKVGDFNENHDEKGQFASGSEGGSTWGVAENFDYSMNAMPGSAGQRLIGKSPNGRATLAIHQSGSWGHSYSGAGKEGQGAKSLQAHLSNFHSSGRHSK